MSSINIKRRNFLKNSILASVGATTWLGAGSQLGLINSVLANSSAAGDYKALVCIFLYGGNDSFNMVIPSSNSGYSSYQSTRQNMAIDQQTLLPVSPLNPVADTYGFNPALQPVHDLFNQGKLAVVNNIGALIEPVTKDEIFQGNIQLPPQLFSHNDQQRHWQTAWPQQNQGTGWAGRMADLIADTNTNLSMNISLNGTNFLQTGINGGAYSMSANGAPLMAALTPGVEVGNEQRLATIQKLTASSQHLLEKEFGVSISRASELSSLVNTALNDAPEMSGFFKNQNPVSNDLAMVAQMISVEQQLPQPQQIFLVGMGGWDTHDNQILSHANLLNDLSQAMADFYQALDSINKNSEVTTFTMSDFGRTLTSNGDGTDHGWGGVQMVMGDAVAGGKFYGEIPDLSLNSNDDFGDGRIIPTTSADQYAATLASWYGLTDNDLLQVFPNLSNFNNQNLGFMG